MLSLFLNIAILSFLIILAIPETKKNIIRSVSFLASIILFFFSLLIWTNYYSDKIATFQLVSRTEWLNFGLFNSHFSLGVDGISLFFIILTTFIFSLCFLNSWKKDTKVKEFILSFLLLEIFLLCAFMVLDILLFYLFFEGVLIPMFVIILIWGSGERRIKASYYLFIYTVTCSIFMLIAIILIYIQTGSTNFEVLFNLNLSSKKQLILWACFFLGFAVKIPMFPVHIWLPEAHVEAPTEGSVILASLLLKLGGYGFIRISLPMFPIANLYFAPLVYTLCIVAIVYTSLTTIRQIDLKKIIAYSSVAHMNLVILGIFSFNIQGIQGAIFLMLAHGIVSGGLFFMVGVLYDRYHSRLLEYYGGLVQIMPLYSLFFLILIFANMSLPGTCNFVGELLIFVGIFQQNSVIAFLAGIGIVLSAVYSIWLFNRVVFSSLNIKYIKMFKDLNRLEFCTLLPLIILTVFLGIFPNVILDAMFFSIKLLLVSFY